MLRLIWGCFQSKGSLLNYHNEDCMRAAKIMLQISGYFPVCSLRHQLLLSIFPSQNGLEQRWFLKRRVEELLAQKGFCWPSTGWPEHALQRRVSFAMAKGTASPMYSSLESKQRGFCRPRQLLLVWRHLVLLLLPSLARRQSRSSWSQLASGWLYPLENQKIFLIWFCGGWILDKYLKNLIRKTCRNGFRGSNESGQYCKALLLTAPVMLWPGSWASNQERIRALQLTLFHPNFS